MRLVLSVDVGYRNCAKVLGRVTPRGDGSVHVEVLKAEVCDVLKGKKPTTVAATALKVVDHLLPWFESSTEVVCEAQVRKSGMNFGIAHAILGAAHTKHLPFSFMAAKQKFQGLEQQTDELNLKKRAVAEVQWHIATPRAHLVLEYFVPPFSEAKKKDDLADALLQLLSHVGWKHQPSDGGDQPVEVGAPDVGVLEEVAGPGPGAGPRPGRPDEELDLLFERAAYG